ITQPNNHIKPKIKTHQELPGRYGQFFAPVSNMSSSAYISNGIGINYYTGNSQYPVPSGVTSNSAGSSPAHQQQQSQPSGSSTSGSSGINYPTSDPGLRRRLFAGIRPLSVFGRLRQQRSSQHRSISLPESNYATQQIPEYPDNIMHLRGRRGDSHNSHNYRPIPMQKSFHLPASTRSTTTTPSSYLRDAYINFIEPPIIAMSSRWNSTAYLIPTTPHRCLDCVSVYSCVSFWILGFQFQFEFISRVVDHRSCICLSLCRTCVCACLLPKIFELHICTARCVLIISIGVCESQAASGTWQAQLNSTHPGRRALEQWSD
ncbi:uncharacterized protein, partial [Drosophila takahashii]|uniref:uncharacterized protein n=1 Tax=Drosophila takahashii TaxID=29030 RepID=UPI0038993E67